MLKAISRRAVDVACSRRLFGNPVQGGRKLLAVKSVASPAASFRLPRYAGAMLLTLISAGCLTLSYTREGRFGQILRIALGLGLPWIVAWLVPTKRQDQNQSLWRRRYWLRLGLSYLGVLLTGVVLILILPFVMLVLMDSGLM